MTTPEAQSAAAAEVDRAVAAAEAHGVQLFVGEHRADAVAVYQAFNSEIADWALAHQSFDGCPGFNTTRMTWVKPSFGWVLYRSGYGRKHGQDRVLKLWLPHDALASLLAQCQLVDTNKATRASHKASRPVRAVGGGAGGSDSDGDDGEGTCTGGSVGRVQWDPERDVLAPAPNKREPRQMLRRRAIQIGLPGRLSAQYVAAVTRVEDVTPLAHAVGDAHGAKTTKEFDRRLRELRPQLPLEAPYTPTCDKAVLTALAMLPGAPAAAIARVGRGKVTPLPN